MNSKEFNKRWAYAFQFGYVYDQDLDVTAGGKDIKGIRHNERGIDLELYSRRGVHRTAEVDPNAHIGKGCIIGPGAVIGPNVNMGDGNIIGAYCVIGGKKGTVYIGSENTLRPNVVVETPEGDFTRIGSKNDLRENIERDVKIGDECRILSVVSAGCIIGDEVDIERGVILRENITVSSKTTIGIGALVTNDI